MKAMIIGCGKLGSSLALELFRKGNEITVIDKDSDAFYRLGTEFNGNTVLGTGFDKDVLEEAGIQFMDAVIACTGNDEVNALAGRIAKDIYMVPHVVARLYDPKKAKIFQTLGISTISTTGYGVDRIVELLSFDKMDSVAMLGETGDTEIVRIEATDAAQGAKASEMSDGTDYRLLAVVREKESFVPKPDDVIQTGDILYFVVDQKAKKKLKASLGL